MIVVLAPTIAYTHLFIGYTYAQVFKSVWKGYLFAIPVVWAGCMSGAFFAFLISRYLVKDFIKEQIRKSHWLNIRVKAIDEMVES